MGSDNKFDEERPQIKINRKMRVWNKYRYLIIIGAIILAIAVVVAIATSFGKGEGKVENANNSTESQALVIEGNGDTPSQENNGENASQPATQATAPAPAGANVYSLNGKVEQQEFTHGDYYKNCVFLGDAIAYGVGYYYSSVIDPSRVVTDNNTTAVRAISLVDQALSLNPEKLFILVGLNDANVGGWSGATIADNICNLVNEIHGKNGNVKVYVISTLPVTKEYENKEGVAVTQEKIDEANNALKIKLANVNASFIDVASAYKDGTGYLMSDVTSNGYSISKAYYPFMLNGIAEVVK